MFVSTDGGYVNLDHVAEVQHTADGRNFLLKSVDGRTLGKMRDAGAIDLEELTAPIVAAAQGATAVSILVCHTDGRPTEDDLFVERVPIVAWRLAFGGAIPVLIEQTVSSETIFIEMPDGRLLLPEDGSFDNPEAAKADRLQSAQRAWDHRQKAAGGKAA